MPMHMLQRSHSIFGVFAVQILASTPCDSIKIVDAVSPSDFIIDDSHLVNSQMLDRVVVVTISINVIRW